MPIDVSAVASGLGVTTQFKNMRAGKTLSLPQRIAVLAQGASSAVYPTEKQQLTSARDAGSGYGWGSPLHLIAEQLFPRNPDEGVGTIPVTFYPLVDAPGAVAASGAITPSGSQLTAGVYRVKVNNLLSEKFVVTAAMPLADLCAAIASAINAVLSMPVIASVALTPDRVELVSKWAGESANDLAVEMLGDTSLGVTYAITQPTGGLNNPSIAAALGQIGNVWETLVLNALGSSDVASLDELSAVGEGRWGALVRKPFVAFSGSTQTTVAAATAQSATRITDRINAQLVAPGSRDLPFVVAAQELACIARVANNNPPVAYTGQRAHGLTPGPDGAQWDYLQREQAVKAGSSTIEVSDGIVTLADVVTFYAPTGEPTPAYRDVVDLIKLQNILYNVERLFSDPSWKAAPLIGDDQATGNPAARRPKDAISEIDRLIDALAYDAIITNPQAAKKKTIAAIDPTNPKRLNVQLFLQLVGNTAIVDVALNFGFFFGGAAV